MPAYLTPAQRAKARKTFAKSRPTTLRRKQVRKVTKRAMIKSRAPLVETKSRIQSEIEILPQIVNPKTFITANSVFTPLPLHAYTNMEQGLAEDGMIGQSVFSKYLNAKVQVRFPGGDNLIDDRQYPMELIGGWIPVPLALSTFTTPTAGFAMPSDITAFITKRISEYFNSRTDRLDFIPKHASNIRITYRKKIRANQSKNNVLGATSTDLSNEGHIPDVMLYPKWKTNKKVFYEQGASMLGGRRNFYPNYSWIPFLVLYSPMFAGEDGDKPLATDKVPRVSYNVAHYYTDS
jgi:hypothetical protein